MCRQLLYLSVKRPRKISNCNRYRHNYRYFLLLLLLVYCYYHHHRYYSVRTQSLRSGVMRPPGIKGSPDENTAFLSFLSYVAGGFVRAQLKDSPVRRSF